MGVKDPGPRNSRVGSASTSLAGNPNWVKEGPIPRITTCFGALPVMMKPPMPALSPRSTRIRVDRLTAWEAGVGDGVGVAVGVGGGVAIGVAVGVAVGVGVAIGGAVGVGVAV